MNGIYHRYRNSAWWRKVNCSLASMAMAEAIGDGEERLSARQAAILEQMISEKLTTISNRWGLALICSIVCSIFTKWLQGFVSFGDPLTEVYWKRGGGKIYISIIFLHWKSHPTKNSAIELCPFITQLLHVLMGRGQVPSLAPPLRRSLWYICNN